VSILRLAVLLVGLSGCYVTARGGPSFGFDGDRRGATLEVLVGSEIHFGGGEPSASPRDRRFAAFNSLGYKRLHVAGAHHSGAIYEVGAAALLPVQRGPRAMTLLRADLSGAIGYVGGIEGTNNVGTVIRALALVELERYWDGWAIRVGAGVVTESVVVEETVPEPQEYEGSYAPVGAVTVELTPLVARAFAKLMGR